MLGLTLLTLTACSVDEVKKPVTNALKTALTTEKEVLTSVVPNGDHVVAIDGKEVTIPAKTFDGIRTLISTNETISKGLVDIIGDQITEENIAVMAYYAQKYSLDVKTMLETLIGKE